MARSRAAAKNNENWARSIIEAALSDRDELGDVTFGRALTLSEAGGDAATVDLDAVLAHLALALDPRDGHPHADDATELRGDEVRRCIAHCPWPGPFAFVQSRHSCHG